MKPKHDYNKDDYTYNRYQELKDIDGVVIKLIGATKVGTKWQVLRNEPGLSTQDLAIICCKGYMKYGFRSIGNTIIIEERRV